MAEKIRPYLRDMKEAISLAEAALGEKTLAEYADDRLLKAAVERLIEIVSEASRGIPEGLKAEHVHIPWRKIAGIGNVLRHEYRRVVDTVIFGIIRQDFPPLAAVLVLIEAKLDEADS